MQQKSKKTENSALLGTSIPEEAKVSERLKTGPTAAHTTGARKKEDDLTLRVDVDDDLDYKASIDISRRTAPKDNTYIDGKVTVISKMYSFVNFWNSSLIFFTLQRC